MRILQKRVQKTECLRSSEVQRYKKYFNECYSVRFDPKVEDKETITTTTSEWGTFREIKSDQFRFTAYSEYYYGNFGEYFPDGGFYQDFYPYDMT